MTAWLTPRRAKLLTLLLLVTFVAVGAWNFAGRHLPRGDDLASSYIGCRLLAAGEGAHLFSHDDKKFFETNADDDDVWSRVAEPGGYSEFHHPYVQTPLWAWALRPLCALQWVWFERLFDVLDLLAFAGCGWIAARFWSGSPRLALLLTALLLPWLWFSEPFRYAFLLAQNHILFVFLTLAALVLAQRDRPVEAGLALALASAVKVTPIVFVLYWLVNRRRAAAASAVGFSVVLLAASYLVNGPALLQDYFATLERVQHLLLLSSNNQSLAAWWMGRFYPPSEINGSTQFHLPAVVRATSSVLLLASATMGGWIDRRGSAAPAGAMITLVAATVFAPVAWTHYSVMLYLPLYVLLTQARALRWPWMAVAAVVVAALNVPPFAPDLVNLWLPATAPLRAQFYACVLTLGALLATGWASRRASRSQADTLSSAGPGRLPY